MAHRYDKQVRDAARRRGFSLVEMLLALALMGLLAAVAIPYLRPSVHEHLQAAARIVVSDLEVARNLAVTYGSSYRVKFDLSNDRYVLEHSGSNPLLDTLPPSPFARPDDPADQWFTRLDELPHPGPRVKLASVVSDGVRVNRVDFQSLGQTARATETVVWLSCSAGTDRRFLPVHVHPVTGIAEIGDFCDIPPIAALVAGTP